jgi:Tol biopolymer transport system component
LASVGSTPDSLSCSPDGSIIRFTKESAIWEISSSGSNLRQLLPGWRTTHSQCCGSWFPDGTFFVFLSGPGPQIWALDEQRGLFGKKPAQPVQLTSGPIRWGNPISSKDGKKIFASGRTSRGELVRFDPQSRQLRPFLAGISAEFVSFSKDGQAVAYVSYPDGILWRAKVDGSERVQLSEPPIYPRSLSWSPDGTQILFVDSSSEGRAEVWIVSSQGGGLRRLLPTDTAQETDPNWSPDGRDIVFSTSEEGGGDRNSTIRILDFVTLQVTTVPGSVGMYSPHWSPDGHALNALSFDASSLHIFDTQTQRWSTLYKGELAFPAWSEDSHSIFFMKYRSDPGVFRIRMKGVEPERIVDLKDVNTTGFYGLWLGLDPTDAPLLLRDVGTDDIYALTLEQR